MKTSDFDYELPEGSIAQEPVEPRDASRLLVYYRQTSMIQHAHFKDLGKFLRPGDLLVLNKTRVIPARLFARKLPSGGRIEVLLLRRRDLLTWEALVRGKRLLPGKTLEVENGPGAVILEDLGSSRRLIKFDRPLEAELDRIGHVPLPPYIHKPITDGQRYQTIYAKVPGSAAAPTAGLHFTGELMKKLGDQGVLFCEITLHIGLDTFSPVNEDTPLEHKIHTEWCLIDDTAAEKINEARRKGNRIIAVGTTSVRALESASRDANGAGIIGSFCGATDLFILPGYSFQAVDGIITNFHLPRSTLIMLVSAFVGREKILEIYQLAILEKYRFYSFGDAMLLF